VLYYERKQVRTFATLVDACSSRPKLRVAASLAALSLATALPPLLISDDDDDDDDDDCWYVDGCISAAATAAAAAPAATATTTATANAAGRDDDDDDDDDDDKAKIFILYTRCLIAGRWTNESSFVSLSLSLCVCVSRLYASERSLLQ